MSRTYAANDREFRTICKELKCNDPTVTELVVSFEVSMGYGKSLGLALHGNSHLTTLQLSVHTLLSSKELHTESALGLINFIRSSPSLQTVNLRHHPTLRRTWLLHTRRSRSLPPHHTQRNKILVERILHAVVENEGCESFTYKGCLHDPLLLVNLLKAPHIKLLDMEIGHVEDTAAQQQIVDAYRMNETLEDITLHKWKYMELNLKVLIQLGHHPRLQRLRLSSFCDRGMSIGNVPALAHLLSRTRSLQVLTLEFLRFDKVSIEVFLAALTCNRTVTALYLRSCKMDEEATRVFTGFVRENANCNGNTLRLLSLELVSLASYPIDNALLSMMRGSSLENLHLTICPGWGDTSNLFSCLSENASVIRLTKLVVVIAANGELRKLNQFLLQTTTLTEICIYPLAHIDTSVHVVLAGLRQNGSLQTTDMDIFNDLESQFVSACCRRNTCISSVIAEASSSTCRRAPSFGADAMQDDNSVALLPSLFQVAKQAKRYAPRNILIGLQTLTLDMPVAAARPHVSNHEPGNSTTVNAVPLTMGRKWTLRLNSVRRWRPAIQR
jgi:hypothetical protein